MHSTPRGLPNSDSATLHSVSDPMHDDLLRAFLLRRSQANPYTSANQVRAFQLRVKRCEIEPTIAISEISLSQLTSENRRPAPRTF